MSVVVKQTAEFKSAVAEFLMQAKRAAEDAATGIAKVAFDNLLKESPQYSGDFVASWRVGYGKIDYTLEKGLYPEAEFPSMTPFARGSTEPMDHARAYAKWGRVPLGESIFLSNSATHDEPYAMMIEEGLIKFRPLNTGSERLVERTMEHANRRFRTIGSAELKLLRSLGV
jgi:hypothetical protein